GLSEELLDRRGGCRGPLALQTNDHRLVLGVHEVRFDEAARQQRTADEGHEEDDVLAEQPAPPIRQDILSWWDLLVGHASSKPSAPRSAATRTTRSAPQAPRRRTPG